MVLKSTMFSTTEADLTAQYFGPFKGKRVILFLSKSKTCPYTKAVLSREICIL